MLNSSVYFNGTFYPVQLQEWDLSRELKSWCWLPEAEICLRLHDNNINNRRKFENEVLQLDINLSSIEQLIHNTAGNVSCTEVERLARCIKFMHKRLISCKKEIEQLACGLNGLFVAVSEAECPCAVTALVSYSNKECEIIKDKVYMLVDNSDPVWWMVELPGRGASVDVIVPSIFFRLPRDNTTTETITNVYNRFVQIWKSGIELFQTKARSLLLQKLTANELHEREKMQLVSLLDDTALDVLYVPASNARDPIDLVSKLVRLLTNTTQGTPCAVSSDGAKEKTWSDSFRIYLKYLKLSKECARSLVSVSVYRSSSVGLTGELDVNARRPPGTSDGTSVPASSVEILAGSCLSKISRDSGQQQYDKGSVVKQACDKSAIGRCDEMMQFSTHLSHLHCDQCHVPSVRCEENVDETLPPPRDQNITHFEIEKPRLAPTKQTDDAEPLLSDASSDSSCEVVSPRSRETESSCIVSATWQSVDRLKKAHRTPSTATSPSGPTKSTGDDIKSDSGSMAGRCNQHCSDKTDKICCDKGADDLNVCQATGEPFLNALASSDEAPKLPFTEHSDRNCLTYKQSINLQPNVAKADDVYASGRREEIEVEHCEMFKHTKICMRINKEKQIACTECEVENDDELVAKLDTEYRSQQLQEAVENADEHGKRTPQISRDKLSPNVVASAEKSLAPPIEKKSSRIRGISRSASNNAGGRMLSVDDKNFSVSEKGPHSGSASVSQLPLNDVKSRRQTDSVAEIDATSVDSSSSASRRKPCELVHRSTAVVLIGNQTNEICEPRQVNRAPATGPSSVSIIEPVQFWVSASSSSIERSLSDEQLDVVEQLIEDFDSRCTALSSEHISRDFGESANHMLKLIDSIRKLILQQFACRRNAHARSVLHEDHPCHRDINSLAVSTQQQLQDSDTFTAGADDCCDNRSREMLDETVKKFGEMKTIIGRFEDLITKAGRLVGLVMKATNVGRKLSSSISLASKVSETYLNNPVERLDTLMERVTEALSQSTASVVKDQSTDIELNVDNMIANGLRCGASGGGGISVRNTEFKDDYSEVMNQCYSFEETVDRLTDVVSTAPEFLEYHSVQCRIDAVRDKRGTAEQLSANRWTLAAVAKFNEVNEELHIAMLNFRQAANKIDCPLDACGAECIHVLMRQAQLLLDTAIEKTRAVDDLMTEGQCLLASLADDQSQCMSAKIGNTIESFRQIEVDLLLRIQKFKKTLEELGLNFADYGDFSFLAWKQRFARFMTRKELQLLDVLRNHVKSDDRQDGVLGVVTRRGFVSAFLATGFHTTQEELYSAYDVISATCTVQITGQQIIDAVSLPNETKVHLPAIALSPVDEHVQKLVEEQLALCRCQKRFNITHVGNALYKFGDRRYANSVKAFSSSALIRVGSGWMPLAAYLDSVDPCRVKQRVVGDGSQSQANAGSPVKGLSTRSSGNLLKTDTSVTSSSKTVTTPVNTRLKTNSLRKNGAKVTNTPAEKEH